jgi:hypothetical protein
MKLWVDMSGTSRFLGKQDFRRTGFGSRLLAAEGEGGGGSEGERGEDRCG